MAKSRKNNGAAAIAILKSDHRRVERLFERYHKSRSPDLKARLARQICLELSVHTMIEEELFYPAVQGAVEVDTRDEAYVEHDAAKHLIAELLQGGPHDDFYDAKVTVLSQMIKHHVREEEQPGGMFAQARKDDIEFDRLARKMKSRKAELVARMKSGGIPLPATRSMKGMVLEHLRP